MKLRYLILALLTLTTATALTAQTRTMTSAEARAKAKAARSVVKDVRGRNYGRATTTVLADKHVSRHVKVDPSLQNKIADPKLVSNARKAPAEIRKNPRAFAKKNAKTIRELKKHGPNWFRGKSKGRTVPKK